jgi:hypothetical protein
LLVAGGVDAITQPFRGRGIENITGLFEGGKRVGVEHFGPHIAVIAGGITAAPEEMGKVRQTMPHHDFVRHADALEACRFGRPRVERWIAGIGRRQRMQIEVGFGASNVFERGETFIEITRGDEPGQQLLRHRRAGLVMQREAPQQLRLLQPMLE